MEILLSLLMLVVCLFIGVSIPLSFVAASAVIVFLGAYDPLFLFSYGFSKMNSILLLSIPLFVLAGSIMNKGGLGEKLIQCIERTGIGRIKGGLGAVTAIACAVFGAVSGSASATLSCIGSIMSPRLVENGYDRGFVGALISSCSVLGLLIPPSMAMILFAWIGGQSVLACFLATVLPGILLVILFSLVNFAYAKKNPNIKVTPKKVRQPKGEAAEAEAMPGLPKKRKTTTIPALMMPVIILGSIYGGFMTPTEAAALSVLYAIPVGMFYYKQLSVRDLGGAVIEAGITTGVIMIMLFTVTILSRLYTMENVPQNLLAMLYSISENKYILLILINIFMVIVGMLMDDTSAMLLVTPILLPIAVELGISPIHLAAIVGVNLGMGNITPPTAPLLYLAGRITEAETETMLKPTMSMIIFAWTPTLILTTYIPEFSLFLPKAFGVM